jgi:hypothetical protein
MFFRLLTRACYHVLYNILNPWHSSRGAMILFPPAFFIPVPFTFFTTAVGIAQF